VKREILPLPAELDAAIRARALRIPIVSGLGITVETLGKGVCVATGRHDHRFDGIFESFHGGLLMTVADTIACIAIMTEIGVVDTMATTDMNIRFLAPCLSDVTAVARTIKIGKLLCPVEVEMFDERKKLVAIAQIAYMRMDKIPGRSS
jgi:uncharacterized protein (TIGR00369 family)